MTCPLSRLLLQPRSLAVRCGGEQARCDGLQQAHGRCCRFRYRRNTGLFRHIQPPVPSLDVHEPRPLLLLWMYYPKPLSHSSLKVHLVCSKKCHLARWIQCAGFCSLGVVFLCDFLSGFISREARSRRLLSGKNIWVVRPAPGVRKRATSGSVVSQYERQSL